MSLHETNQCNGTPTRQQRRQAARQANKAGAPGTANANHSPMVKQAIALHEAGRFGDALELYRQILTQQPDHVDALNFAGIAAFQLGDRELALSLLRTAIAHKPDFTEAHSNIGNVLAVLGRPEQAVVAYRRAIEIDPGHANAHYNLGATLHAMNRYAEAAAAYRADIALRPDHVAGYTNLAAVLCEIGDLAAAETACRQAIALRPDDAAAHTNLALALRAGGARDEAEAALRRALESDPGCARAHYNLGSILFREDDPEPAAHCFEQALSADPTLGLAHLYLGMIRDVQGETATAAKHFDVLRQNSPVTDHLLNSWTYAKSNRSAVTRLLSDPFETLRHALKHANVDGMVLEFGVRFGTSLNFLAGQLTQEVHGFDSFQGLPEAWDGFDPGLYATDGRLPEVSANARLHVGLFADTLPGFVAEHPSPIRFMNVDCDLYSSARAIFEHLAARVVPGTVIAFDEYLITPTWREDEFKAFQEAVREHGWRYEYLAFNLFSKQAIVRIL